MSNDTPRIAMLNKQKYPFSKIEIRRVKQVLFVGWYQWENGGYKERM
jgi:hypothetical protein